MCASFHDSISGARLFWVGIRGFFNEINIGKTVRAEGLSERNALMGLLVMEVEHMIRNNVSCKGEIKGFLIS